MTQPPSSGRTYAKLALLILLAALIASAFILLEEAQRRNRRNLARGGPRTGPAGHPVDVPRDDARGRDSIAPDPTAWEPARTADRSLSQTSAATVVAKLTRLEAPAEHVELPWQHGGPCAKKTRAGANARSKYLADFIASTVGETTLYAHRSAAALAIAAVRKNAEQAHARATDSLGLVAKPPVIYLHPTVALLREHSCASANADAYYDGAIHLAALPDETEEDLARKLTHEAVHHVLVENGIGKPIWFQEGAAMRIAGERPRDSWAIWRRHPIPISQMVTTFPTTAPPERAAHFYAQAWEMLEFLSRLTLAQPGSETQKLGELQELTRALTTGRTTPEGLFAWATYHRGNDLFRTARLPLWDDYTEHGTFAPATLDALLARSGVRTTARR